MAPRPPHRDTAWGPPPWVLALVLAGVGAGVAWWWWATPPAAPVAAAAPGPAPVQALALPTAPPPMAAASAPEAVARAAPASPQPPQIPRQRDPQGDLTPDLADHVNPGERPTMAEVIQRLHAAGVRTGLGAFQPPGTRPPMVGLAVPEDFPLPAGYVRHYQATDDGQRIEPMLMFSPDVQTVVVNGRTVAVPADRIVTPELAPPGLTVRRIVVPAPVDAPR